MELEGLETIYKSSKHKLENSVKMRVVSFCSDNKKKKFSLTCMI